MGEQRHSSVVDRRSFLKAAGWVAGALVAAPILSTRQPAVGARDSLSRSSGSLVGVQRLKIGVLLPASKVHPALAENLMAGMNLSFQRDERRAGGRQIEVVKEEIGYGPGLALRKSRKLIEVDKVGLVVGVVSSSVAARLVDLFHESQTILLVSNAGANVVRPNERSPYVFYNSLGFWQAGWAMGTWAAANLGKKGFVASSFYDAGYDAPYAFRQGFQRPGGEILQTYVTHTPTDSDDLSPLFAAVKSTKPDFVYASYCGQQAVDFVRAYAGSGLAREIPLVGSGFLVDEGLLPAQGRAARGIKTCLPWSNSLDTAASMAFARAYEKETRRLPDAFAVLGYDTAQLISSAVDAVGGHLRTGDGLRAALGSAEFASPRSLVRMDPHTQSATSPLYLRDVQQRRKALGNVVVSELAHVAQIDEWARSMQLGLKTGWLNGYMCV